MEQPIKKTNFLTLPDLAYGFVHKKSGNEFTKRFKNLKPQTTQILTVAKA